MFSVTKYAVVLFSVVFKRPVRYPSLARLLPSPPPWLKPGRAPPGRLPRSGEGITPPKGWRRMVGCSGGGEATAANATLATAPCAARPRCPDAAGERTAAAEGRLRRAPPGGGLALGLGERSRASSLLLFSTWDGGQHNNAGAPRDF